MKMTPADTLRAMLARNELITMPCCFDALSAKLIEQEGFGLTFMSGFSAAAARIGAPDLGLMSYGEVLDQARNITDAVSIPVIGDGDTGYGNAMNVKRTVRGFAKAGCAAIMIEDQVAPKRCGHTKGKEVVGRDEAFDRIRAAVDARDAGADILILARTDARHEYGLSEAIDRAAKFAELGADILFVEAPKSVDEMRTICNALPGAKMANILEGGETPDLSPAELQEIGFKIAAYPLSLMAAAMKAMVDTLQLLKAGSPRDQMLMKWPELRQRIGFDAYYEQSERYASSRRDK
jgi:2-methylisocitrate lyase-like PEP mutase family enzyme